MDSRSCRKRGWEIFLGFGLPTTVGLLFRAIWRSMFLAESVLRKEKSNRQCFFVGALLFGIVPLSMGILGFIGAGTGYVAADTGVINFELISTLVPKLGGDSVSVYGCVRALSTIDSNLCAIASLTTDIKTKKTSTFGKIAMICLLLVGIAVANIPGLTVTHLFLMYGTLRASNHASNNLYFKGS